MMQKIKTLAKEIGSMSIGLTLAFTIFIGLSIAKGWTEPAVAPPGGNLGAPINTSFFTQLKAGALGINGILQVFSNVGVGTAIPDKIGGIHASGDICTDQGGGRCLSSGGGVTQEVLPYGYVEKDINDGEDIFIDHGFIAGDDPSDECDGNKLEAFSCPVDTVKSCFDVVDASAKGGIMGSQYGYTSRNVICKRATMLIKTVEEDAPQVFYFSGNVDHTLKITLKGTDYSESNETQHGNLSNVHSFSSGGIPTDGTELKINKLSGEDLSITQQPSASNDYTAIIEAYAGSYSEYRYVFYLEKK